MYLKLPSLTKRINSYETFYCKLFKVRTLDDGFKIDCTKVHLTKENEEKLKQHIKREMRKNHKDCTKKFWDYSFAMYWLGYSPSTAGSEYVKNGYAWVDGAEERN